jgi:hypothetical protein
MLFGEQKIRFLIAPIELLWYIRNVFECLEGSKCLFHLKYALHSGFSYLIQKLSPPKFRPNNSILVCRKHVWYLNYKHVRNFEVLRSR